MERKGREKQCARERRLEQKRPTNEKRELRKRDGTGPLRSIDEDVNERCYRKDEEMKTKEKEKGKRKDRRGTGNA